MVGSVSGADGQDREVLLRLLTGATFLIFAQAFMIAPLIPVWRRCSPRQSRRWL